LSNPAATQQLRHGDGRNQADHGENGTPFRIRSEDRKRGKGYSSGVTRFKDGSFSRLEGSQTVLRSTRHRSPRYIGNSWHLQTRPENFCVRGPSKKSAEKETGDERPSEIASLEYLHEGSTFINEILWFSKFLIF
jgi:hypothetical protein